MKGNNSVFSMLLKWFSSLEFSSGNVVNLQYVSIFSCSRVHSINWNPFLGYSVSWRMEEKGYSICLSHLHMEDVFCSHTLLNFRKVRPTNCVSVCAHMFMCVCVCIYMCMHTHTCIHTHILPVA